LDVIKRRLKTGSMSSITSAPSRQHVARRLHPRTAFWTTAAAFLIVMAYSTVPTPLWGLYQHRDGFSTFAITLAFAAYAAGTVVALFFAGHLGDTLGRRQLLLPAIALEIVSAIIFIAWPSLPGLVTARVISGLGIGMLTATATAHVIGLHVMARPGAGAQRGQIVAGVANLGGFGVGALVSGVLAQWVTGPLVTPYVVFLGLLTLAFIVIAVSPESAERPATPPRYRPQRVRVPQESRARFVLVCVVTFAAFSILGLFTSLAPGFLAGQLGITSRAVAGGVVFVTFTAGAVSQILVRPLSARAQIALGTILLVIGLGTVAVVVSTGAGLAPFVIGGVVSGAGAGPLFKAALSIGGALADPAHRGEVLAGIFLAGYLGLAVPVVGIGIASLSMSLVSALIWFAVIIVTVTLVAAVPLVLGRQRIGA
jgi:predicted MFS family arabinose efflux permease